MVIYNSLFESRLRYGLLGWGTAPEASISKLRVLQNRAVRFITFAPFHFYVLPLFSTLNVLPFDDLLFLQKSIFMHNFRYKNLPFMLSSYCFPVSHSISTRYASNMNYRIPLYKTNRGQKSIKYTGPKVWSEIPKEIKLLAYRKPFSKKLKTYLLSILSEKARNLPVQSETPPWLIEEVDESDQLLNTFDISLTEIFENDSVDETFYGFDVVSNPSDILQSDSGNF